MELEKLKKHFYDTFKKYNYDEVINYLQDVNTREKLIQEIAETQEQAYNLNANYEKALAQVVKIFKPLNDRKKELEKAIEKEEATNRKLKNKRDQEHEKGILKIIGALFVGGRVASKTKKKSFYK